MHPIAGFVAEKLGAIFVDFAGQHHITENPSSRKRYKNKAR